MQQTSVKNTLMYLTKYVVERERELQGVTRTEISQRVTSACEKIPFALGKSDSLNLEFFYALV